MVGFARLYRFYFVYLTLTTTFGAYYEGLLSVKKES